MRALLLYNPNATTTTESVLDEITDRLRRSLRLEVAPTKRRDHASYLAAGAADEGYEVVLALGGDGTVNEVVQGLARSRVMLGVIPGGSTNVYARSLGLPNDALRATEELLTLLAARHSRLVRLGTANDRYFCFSAGYGYDAEVVRQVERRPRLKRVIKQGAFLYAGVATYLRTYDPRGSSITVDADGDHVEGCPAVICGASQPYTYLGPWPARVCPDADLETGLDVTALTRLRLRGLTRFARTALGGGDVRDLAHVRGWHDLDKARLSSFEPLPLQLDGDFVGDVTTVELATVRDALRVVAPERPQA